MIEISNNPDNMTYWNSIDEYSLTDALINEARISEGLSKEEFTSTRYIGKQIIVSVNQSGQKYFEQLPKSGTTNILIITE